MGSAWTDFQGTLSTRQRILPSVRAPKHIGLAAQDPTVLPGQRTRAINALASPGEITQTRPENGVGRKPIRLQRRVISAQVWIILELPQGVDQMPPSPANAKCVAFYERVGGIPPVCLLKQPSRKAQSTEACSQPASENKLIR